MTFPVDQPYEITTQFNLQTHPGIDIAPLPGGIRGVQCHAPEGGRILASGYIAALEGNYVVMQGDSGMFYYFGHFETRLVNSNDTVSEGQAIGIIGMTGAATGVHTHHEVRRTQSGSQIDPVEYYKSKEDDMSDIADHDFVADACVLGMDLQPETNQVFLNNVGLPKSQVLKNILGYTESRNLRLDAEAYRAGQSASATVLKKGTYRVE